MRSLPVELGTFGSGQRGKAGANAAAARIQEQVQIARKKQDGQEKSLIKVV